MEMSISFRTNTAMTNIAHNNSDLSDEEFKEEAHRHINKELIKDNIVIKQESIKDVYEREFGEVLEHYNPKQTILSTSSPQTYKKEAFKPLFLSFKHSVTVHLLSNIM